MAIVAYVSGKRLLEDPSARTLLSPVRERCGGREGGDGGPERTGLEVAAVVPAFARAPHEAGQLEHAQVLRYGRKRHVERLGELRDRSAAPGETREHPPSRGVGQRGKH